MPKKKEIWCTNVTGASQILNKHSRTVSNYVKDGLIDGSFKFGQNTLIPMADIAKLMKTNESNIVKFAKTWDLPLWRCKK